ncbi:MAG: hypothetical protein GY722_23675 [bacterium]|nr:hypothetical protein [bacterium]
MSFRTAYLTFFALGPRVAIAIMMRNASVYYFIGATSLRLGLWLAFWVFGWMVVLFGVWRNPRMPQEKRRFWTAAIVVGNFHSLPFYWWRYVRGGDPRPGRLSRSSRDV